MKHIWIQLNKRTFQCKRCELIKTISFEKKLLPNGSKMLVPVGIFHDKQMNQGFKKCFEPKQYKLAL